MRYETTLLDIDHMTFGYKIIEILITVTEVRIRKEAGRKMKTLFICSLV